MQVYFTVNVGRNFETQAGVHLSRGFTVQSKPTMGLKQSTINYSLHKNVEEGV